VTSPYHRLLAFLVRALVLCGVVALCQSCTAEPRSAAFSFSFERPEDAVRARVVEATIAEGGCGGAVVYTSLFRVDGPGAVPPVLGPGTYGLGGRARDASCVWFAGGCAAVTLPLDGVDSVHVVLGLEPEAAACDPAECTDGLCSTDVPPDAGVPDGGPPPDRVGVDVVLPDGAPGAVIPSNVTGTIAPGTGLADITVTGVWVIDTDDGSIDVYASPDRSGSASAVRGPGEGVDAEIRFEVVDQSSGPELAVLTLESLTVAPSATLVGIGSRALVLLVGSSAQIDGQIVVGADFFTGERHEGPGAGAGGVGGASSGSGPGGGGLGAAGTAGGPDDGGGGGGFGSDGAGGGAEAGDGAGGAPGDAYGNETLVPLVGGSGGGGGASFTDGHGGGGGGALQISAGVSIEIGASGRIDACGGGGLGGVFLMNMGGGAGGGGSGGAVLLEAPTVELLGRVGANGGAGGQGNTAVGMPGARGARGIVDSAPASGTATVGFGGGGGSGSDATGAAGDGLSATNAGGGGGGAGRVRINDGTGDRSRYAGVVLPSSGALFTAGTVQRAP
jgi:hypothetical protein